MILQKEHCDQDAVSEREKSGNKAAPPSRVVRLRERVAIARARLAYLAADRLNHTYALVGKINRAGPMVTSRDAQGIPGTTSGRQPESHGREGKPDLGTDTDGKSR